MFCVDVGLCRLVRVRAAPIRPLQLSQLILAHYVKTFGVVDVFGARD